MWTVNSVKIKTNTLSYRKWICLVKSASHKLNLIDIANVTLATRWTIVLGVLVCAVGRGDGCRRLRRQHVNVGTPPFRPKWWTGVSRAQMAIVAVVVRPVCWREGAHSRTEHSKIGETTTACVVAAWSGGSRAVDIWYVEAWGGRNGLGSSGENA